ncbi:MAG TPA: aldo/keto reductase, partial [Mycobacteriales bacterium]|nr:aldo/keto reductase [Mycobacteriales bacterium]
MRYRPLGRSGLVVSVVGLGLNNVGRSMDAAGTRKTLDAALDGGVTLLDTADVYGTHPGESEEILGEVLGTDRERFVLATKFGG